MKILYFVTEDWFFCSHRLDLARSAKIVGHNVVVVTRVRDHGEEIKQAGLRLIPFENRRGGTNLLVELWTMFRLILVYWKERPDLVHNVAMKPVLYGSIAAKVVRIPWVVNAITGLGSLFSSDTRLARFLNRVLRAPLGYLLRRGKVIVQNDDDEAVVRSLHVEDVRVIRGSGVDVDRFAPVAEPDGIPVVILVARLLREKGIEEYASAARLLRQRGVTARFVLVGAPDPDNRSSFSQHQIDDWVSAGIIEWWGQRDDMPAVLAQAHIACLPSYYREGVPKSLLEAAACGLAIVTTDMPGCRDIVRDNQNGLLVPARDVESLAIALERLVVDKQLRKKMGERGRALVLKHFTDSHVIESTLNLYREFDEPLSAVGH